MDTYTAPFVVGHDVALGVGSVKPLASELRFLLSASVGWRNLHIVAQYSVGGYTR